MKMITFVLVLLVLSGCDTKLESVKLVKHGVKLGWHCADHNITLEECELILDAEIVKRLYE